MNVLLELKEAHKIYKEDQHSCLKARRRIHMEGNNFEEDQIRNLNIKVRGHKKEDSEEGNLTDNRCSKAMGHGNMSESLFQMVSVNDT